MATQLVRYIPPSGGMHGRPRWGVVFGQRIAPLNGSFPTTGDVIRHGQAQIPLIQPKHADIELSTVKVLSPITDNQQFLCRGANDESHVRESRLGLVLGRDMKGQQTVSASTLHEALAGVTLIHDVSARDVQLPQAQHYKGKIDRTFGHTGPFLVLLSPQEWLLWPQLRMRLSVNDQIRQDAYCGAMLHNLHQTLAEFSQQQDLYAGDVIATGTPARCAATAPGRAELETKVVAA